MFPTILILFLAIVHHASLGQTATTNGLENKVFEKLLKDMGKSSASEDSFLPIMWPEIVKFFPGVVNVPGLQYTDPTTVPGTSMCQTESNINPKLGDMIPAVTKRLPGDKLISVEIFAKLDISSTKKPMEFKLFPEVSTQGNPPVEVGYVFSGMNTVKMNLLIPTFSEFNTPKNPECLVKIEDIEVVKLGNPSAFTNSDSKTVVHNMRMHWIIVGQTSTQMADTITFALRKAVNDQTQNKNLWICPSEELQRKASDQSWFAYKDVCRINI